MLLWLSFVIHILYTSWLWRSSAFPWIHHCLLWLFVLLKQWQKGGQRQRPFLSWQRQRCMQYAQPVKVWKPCKAAHILSSPRDVQIEVMLACCLLTFQHPSRLWHWISNSDTHEDECNVCQTLWRQCCENLHHQCPWRVQILVSASSCFVARWSFNVLQHRPAASPWKW